MQEKERQTLIVHLSDFIRQEWAAEETLIASFYAGALGDEVAGRALIQSFIGLCDDLKIVPDGHSEEAVACLHALRKVLEKTLAVDMSKPSNRKGDLPRALGFVSRKDAGNRIRDHVIYGAMEHAMYHTGVAGRSHEECADLIAAAFELSGKLQAAEDGGLTTEQIEKIYQRTKAALMA